MLLRESGRFLFTMGCDLIALCQGNDSPDHYALRRESLISRSVGILNLAGALVAVVYPCCENWGVMSSAIIVSSIFAHDFLVLGNAEREQLEQKLARRIRLNGDKIDNSISSLIEIKEMILEGLSPTSPPKVLEGTWILKHALNGCDSIARRLR